MASNSHTQNNGTGDTTTIVDAWYDSETGNSVRLCVRTRIHGNSTYGPSGYGVVGQSGYVGNGIDWYEVGRGVLNYGNTVVDGTAYFTVSKTHSGWTANCWAKMWGDTVSGYSGYNGDDDVRCDVWIPATSSYTVSYNANSGSGAPGNQTKWYGETLTLSSTKPTRSGYTFVGWSTSSNATSASYSAGGSYTGNSSITLYAVWNKNALVCTLAYNANGGSGAPSSQIHVQYTTSKISSGKPTRANYTFLGWSTSSTATTATYLTDGQYTNNSFSSGATITLYAVWKKKYSPVFINVPPDNLKGIYVSVPTGKTLKGIYYNT